MYSDNLSLCPYPVYLPNGKPAPLVLTEDDLIALLRLDAQSGGPKNPKYTLEYYRERGLRAVYIGKRLRYYLPDVIEFLDNQSAWTNRKNVS